MSQGASSNVRFNYQNTMQFDKVIAKIKGCNFCHTVYVVEIHKVGDVTLFQSDLLHVCRRWPTVFQFCAPSACGHPCEPLRQFVLR